MDANTVFLILQLFFFLLFVAVIIFGDVYLTYMVFNSSSYTCENFINPTIKGKSPDTTTIKPFYSVCYNLSSAQIGFAKFMTIMFWILFTVFTFSAIYLLYSYLDNNELIFIIAIAILIVMSVFILVGGIFLSQYVFTGESKNCFLPNTPLQTANTTIQYCYNMDNIKLSFSKIAVVFNWIYSIAIILGLGAFIYQANLG